MRRAAVRILIRTIAGILLLQLSCWAGEERDAGVALLERAGEARAKAEYEEARRLGYEAIACFGSDEQKSLRAKALAFTASVESILTHIPESRRLFAEALEIHERLGEQSGIVSVLTSIADLHGAAGDYDQALRGYERALDLARGLEGSYTAARVAHNMGWLQSMIGNHEEALALYREARATWAAQGKEYPVAFVDGSIAEVLTSLGRRDEARPLLERSLAYFREHDRPADTARIHVALGRLEAEEGRPVDALALFREALAVLERIDRKGDEFSTNLLIGRTLTQLGRLDDAEAVFAHTLAIKSLGPNLDNEVRYWGGVAELSLARKRPEEALSRAREGVRVIDRLSERLGDVEGAASREAFRDVFDVGFRAALELGSTEDVVALIESGRAASLRESLGSRNAIRSVVLAPDLEAHIAAAQRTARRAHAAYQRARRESARLSELRATRSAWEQARSALDRVQLRADRELKAAADALLLPADDMATIQARLGPAEALLYYGLASTDAFAVVLRRHAARLVRLGRSKDVEAAARAALSGEQHVDPAAFPALRAKVVDPLELGEGVTRLLVSPTGILGLVPFAALVPDKDVAFVQSGTTHGLLVQAGPPRGTMVLGLGDPDYGKADTVRMPRLASSGREVERVADVGLLRAEATETNLRRAIQAPPDGGRWRAVHLACHGTVDPLLPLRSALVMTADDENDGLLTVQDVFGMKVPADLVALSACETGSGRIYRTEGIVGLVRAFLFAGAPRVLCSLWKVDDQATTELMTRFYALWRPKEGVGISAAAALRQAQTYVSSQPQWKHPYFWAGWALWGLAL